jgi:hypothetical protein
MESSNDFNHTYDIDQNKDNAALKKHLHFYDHKHAFISIDRTIVNELHLTENDSFTEEITKDGILLRRASKKEY